MWGAGLGQFCNNYAFNFVISWLPLYLVKARGMSIEQMAELSGLVYIVFAASSMSAGWLSDRWIRGGASDNRVRKTIIISGQAIMAASLIAVALGDLRVTVVSLFCAGVAFGFNAPTLFAIGQTLAGPQVAGKWMGIQNGFASLASIVAPIITGLVIDVSGQYYWAFIIAVAAATTGIIGWGLMIRKVEPLDWATVIEPTGATARNPT
jgi:sugar phosphate permease